MNITSHAACRGRRQVAGWRQAPGTPPQTPCMHPPDLLAPLTVVSTIVPSCFIWMTVSHASDMSLGLTASAPACTCASASVSAARQGTRLRRCCGCRRAAACCTAARAGCRTAAGRAATAWGRGKAAGTVAGGGSVVGGGGGVHHRTASASGWHASNGSFNMHHALAAHRGRRRREPQRDECRHWLCRAAGRLARGCKACKGFKNPKLTRESGAEGGVRSERAGGRRGSSAASHKRCAGCRGCNVPVGSSAGPAGRPPCCALTQQRPSRVHGPGAATLPARPPSRPTLVWKPSSGGTMAAAVPVQRGAAIGSSRIARSGAQARPAAAGATPQSALGGDRGARRPPANSSARRRPLESRPPLPPFPAAVRVAQRSVVTKAQQKREMMMWEALREGLDEEMERDPTVCLMGAWPPPPAAVAAAHRRCRIAGRPKPSCCRSNGSPWPGPADSEPEPQNCGQEQPPHVSAAAAAPDWPAWDRRR